jgi:DNA-binding NtrC family response regulator
MKEIGCKAMSPDVAVCREAVPMNILIVDDEQAIREACAAVAEQCGMKALTVATAEEALELLEQSAIDILLTDLKLKETSGLDLIQRARESYPDVVAIILTQYGTIDSAVQATRLGALDYVTKPFRIEELQARLERVKRAVELQQETGCCGSSCVPGRGSAGSSGYPRRCSGFTK